MKRYITRYILSAFVLSLLCACNEEQIPLYQTQHFVHFKQLSEKPYRFSFATTPGQKEYVLEIPMLLIGQQLPEDRVYNIEVVTEGENATTAPAASYELPENPVFHKNSFEDKLSVKLIDNPELATEKRIVLRVAGNADFQPGPAIYRTAVIWITNRISQPEWWDEDFEKIFLGPYSDIKYQHFIIATGISDLSETSIQEISAYVSDYIYYLRKLDDQGKTVYESDGKTKVLDTISYTNA